MSTNLVPGRLWWKKRKAKQETAYKRVDDTADPWDVGTEPMFMKHAHKKLDSYELRSQAMR
jgi:hypothetical protein